MTLTENICEKSKVSFSTYINELYTSQANSVSMLLNEKLSYWEMRQFMNLIFNQVKDHTTKNVVKELLRVLTKLEIMNVPIPVLRRQR